MTDRFEIVTNSPVPFGKLLTGTITSDTLPRATLWLFPPGIQPTAAGGTWREIKRARVWAKSIKRGQAFKLRTQRLKKRGVFTLVCHVPKEPGSVAGDYEQAVTVEVV